METNLRKKSIAELTQIAGKNIYKSQPLHRQRELLAREIEFLYKKGSIVFSNEYCTIYQQKNYDKFIRVDKVLKTEIIVDTYFDYYNVLINDEYVKNNNSEHCPFCGAPYKTKVSGALVKYKYDCERGHRWGTNENYNKNNIKL